MITYELAKALKDAGFPQKFGAEGILHQPNEIHVSYPTLSELIEACGDRFGKLEAQLTSKEFCCPPKGREWVATNCYACIERITTHGTTPEEAVARLWLALNKK
jgi:hypothetical protein